MECILVVRDEQHGSLILDLRWNLCYAISYLESYLESVMVDVLDPWLFQLFILQSNNNKLYVSIIHIIFKKLLIQGFGSMSHEPKNVKKTFLNRKKSTVFFKEKF